MNQPLYLKEEEKSRQLPGDAAALMAELSEHQSERKRNELSEQAQEHLRAFAKFYLWADPLFQLGHISIKHRIVAFDALVAKRFRIGLGSDKLPKIEVQSSEMAWINVIPWLMAGIHYASNRIFLFTSPASPLASFAFVLPIDTAEKIACFKDKRYLNITEAALNIGVPARRITLELRVVDDHFFTRRKHKAGM